MDKISGQLSLKIQDSPGGGSSAPAPEQEAPKAKKEESRSRFSFQQYGDKDESKSAPEATSKPPGDALPAPAAEPKEEKASKGLPFSFSFGKKDDAASPAPAANNAPAPLGGPQKANPAPAEPSVSSPAPLSFKAPEQAKPAPKADPAPAPAQGDSKPWWEKAEEVVKPVRNAAEAFLVQYHDCTPNALQCTLQGLAPTHTWSTSGMPCGEIVRVSHRISGCRTRLSRQSR